MMWLAHAPIETSQNVLRPPSAGRTLEGILDNRYISNDMKSLLISLAIVLNRLLRKDTLRYAVGICKKVSAVIPRPPSPSEKDLLCGAEREA